MIITAQEALKQINKTGMPIDIKYKATAHFTWQELMPKQKSNPSITILERLLSCAKVLEVYRAKVFNNKSITVTSGWRSLQDHLRIYAENGVTDMSKIPMNSYHLKGLALDFVVEGYTPFEVYTKLDKVHFGGLEKAPTWIHLDLRGSIIRFDNNNRNLISSYSKIEHDRIFN